MSESKRNTPSIDIGVVEDGTIKVLPDGELILVGDDGTEFSISRHLAALAGKQIRFTCITLESMENLQSMLDAVQGDR